MAPSAAHGAETQPGSARVRLLCRPRPRPEPALLHARGGEWAAAAHLLSPTGEDAPKATLQATAGSLCNKSPPRLRVATRRQQPVSPNHPPAQCRPPARWPQAHGGAPDEPTLRLNLSGRLEMPERASEGRSWAPWHRSVHAVPVWSLTQQRLDQRGGALPRLAVAAATGERARQRAARCRSIPSPAPWAVFPPLCLPCQTKGTSSALCCGRVLGQAGPIILIKEIKPCIDFSPGRHPHARGRL